MSRSTSTIQDRLTNYRPALDDAIARHVPRPVSDTGLVDDNLIDLDWQSAAAGHASIRFRLLVGAAAVVLLVGLAAIVVTRGTPAEAPSNPVARPDTAVVTSAETEDPVVDTAPVGTVTGSGQTPACPAGTGEIPTDTLYLGGPAWAQNLAAKGFILSLPAGSSAVDVAIKAIALPVIGLECSITGAPAVEDGVVTVTVDPPAVPTPLQMDVTVSQSAGIIGVTGIKGSTNFETDSTGDVPSLTVLDGLPSSAVSVQIRFKKGDDVWFLSADPTVGNVIPLAVPDAETDRFADEPVDWVLFTMLDANGRVVDVGGGIV